VTMTRAPSDSERRDPDPTDPDPTDPDPTDPDPTGASRARQPVVARLFYGLRRLYHLTGIQAAPPGTLLYLLKRAIGRVAAALVAVINRVTSGGLDALDPHHLAAPYQLPPSQAHFDIAAIRLDRRVDGLALIFFMGLGDYLMATPVIEALRRAHPDLPFYAYASSSLDSTNSPLLARMLESNPAIDRVFTYRGRNPGGMWEYDYSDARKDVPEHFLVVPMLYDDAPEMPHRFVSLMNSLGLTLVWPVQPPVLYSTALAGDARDLLRTIRGRVARSGARGIACCHFDARGSGYVYPHGAELAHHLIEEGYFVVSFSPIELTDTRLMVVSVSAITPNETIELLAQLKRDGMPLYIVSVNSVFWAVSAGLGIPNLGMHSFFDPAIHHYVYSNTFVITPYLYPRLAPTQLFLAPRDCCTTGRSKTNHLMFTTYDPDYVVDCFRRFVMIEEGGGSSLADDQAETRAGEAVN
jgi:hypothetical protein